MNSVFRTIDLTCLTTTPILAGHFFTYRYVNYGRLTFSLIFSVAEPAGELELSISHDRYNLSHRHTYTRWPLLPFNYGTGMCPACNAEKSSSVGIHIRLNLGLP
jgi:hypothetical protein